MSVSFRCVTVYESALTALPTNSVIDYRYPYDDDGDPNGMPYITLEVITDNLNDEEYMTTNFHTETQPSSTDEVAKDTTGVHFLMDKDQHELATPLEIRDLKDEGKKDSSKVRCDLLEYMTQDDGSVVCKLCGEILQSRTHWYRHKYKLHVLHPLNPSPLFECGQCRVYFKSRKGYIGHLASRHSDFLTDSNPVLSNSQIEVTPKEAQAPVSPLEATVKDEPDPELSIPMSSVPNYQTTVVKHNSTKSSESKRPGRNKEQPTNERDREEKRSREEKLVSDIIDRVRRECEAQGSGGPTRRGYSRRTTVMHS